LIEDELETEIALNCYDDVEELLHAILARDLPADIIVTFGHVLVQLVDDDQGNNRILGPRAFGVLQRDSDHG
jgi:hypothetical protein